MKRQDAIDISYSLGLIIMEARRQFERKHKFPTGFLKPENYYMLSGDRDILEALEKSVHETRQLIISKIDDERAEERMPISVKAKVLPTIKINGEDYFVDERLKEFRPVNAPFYSLPFDKATRCNGCGEYYREETLEILKEGEGITAEHFPGCPKCKTDNGLMDLEPGINW